MADVLELDTQQIEATRIEPLEAVEVLRIDVDHLGRLFDTHDYYVAACVDAKTANDMGGHLFVSFMMCGVIAGNKNAARDNPHGGVDDGRQRTLADFVLPQSADAAGRMQPD
ncbi:hypothetical protein JQ543_05085 [Bradyrhizobium diazoefficiens]|nr:hypothetical protein [Bradyrhizobium diazoefficiens]MBR0847115.1 hypothetical protein [Bradyrhizobium diazoefficiens]